MTVIHLALHTEVYLEDSQRSMKQRMTVVSCFKVFEEINVPDVAGTASAINATKLKETRAHTYFMSAGGGGGGGYFGSINSIKHLK